MFDRDDDEPAGRKPLPPEDRLWRHPSELNAGRPPPPAAPPRRRGTLAIPLASALTGALVVAAAWLAVSVVDPDSGDEPSANAAVNTVVSAPPRDVTWTEPIAATLEPALPTVKVIKGGDTIVAAGVVLDSSGHIITSAWLVEGADAILVLGPNGARSHARIVALDQITDLAVIHADRDDLTPAPFSLTRHVRVGQYALARDPEGNTSPDGRVVALSTSVAGPTGETLYGVIAFSSPAAAPIPGAAVFDDAGEVFAITSSATAVSAERMGHAIPATVAVHVAEQLINEGQAEHPWLGVQGTDLPPAKAGALGVAGGASITGVAKDGPAANAGLAVGDTVVSANGWTVHSMSDLVMILRGAGAGAEVDLHVVRGGALLTLSSELGDR